MQQNEIPHVAERNFPQREKDAHKECSFDVLVKKVII
jgi:hypothetical protein